MRWNNLIVSAFLRMRLCLWLRFVSRSMGLFAGSARLPVLDPPVFPFLLHSLVLSCLSDDRSVRRSVRLSACACLGADMFALLREHARLRVNVCAYS